MKYFAYAFSISVALCASRGDSQTFTTLVQFTGTGGTANGFFPCGSLTVVGNALHGMTFAGGNGNIFRVAEDGTQYQNILSFTGADGIASGLNPYGNLTLSGTTLYGMTLQGGANFDGNVFSVRTDGTNYRNLVSFTGTGGTANGAESPGSLLLSGATLYGMTIGGGVNGDGNVFSVGVDGTNYHNLLSFTGTGGAAPGALPFGSLILSSTTLYGMTSGGGTNGYGNIFSVGQNGTNYQNLASFTGSGGTATGVLPEGSLTLSGTTLYGVTTEGGVNGDGNVFSVGVDGTNYHNLLSLTGTGSPAAGAGPLGSLLLSGTTLYGTTPAGGANGDGNIFSVGIDGSGYQDLYDFTGRTDGGIPYGDLTLSGGTLFGTTSGGEGQLGDGTVFALAVPEPGTFGLAAIGLSTGAACFGWNRRRRRAGKEASQDFEGILRFPARPARARTVRRAA